MTFIELRRHVVARVREKEALDIEIKQLQQELQEQCSHYSIVETPTMLINGSYALPDRRLCLTCGLEEERGADGYTALTATPESTLDRDDFYRHRTLEQFMVC